MGENQRFPDLDLLLSQADWVQGLARSLVGHGDRADDLIQDAWVAVVEGRMGQSAAPRGWFARVLTNLKRQHGRSEGARAARERRFASEQRRTDPSSTDVVVRAETQHRLVAAVLALGEPDEPLALCMIFVLKPRRVHENGNPVLSEQVPDQLTQLPSRIVRAGTPALGLTDPVRALAIEVEQRFHGVARPIP